MMNPYLLLVRLQTSVATLELPWRILKKAKNKSTVCLNYPIPCNMPERLNTLLLRHLIIHVYCCPPRNSQKQKQFKYPSTNEWLMKMWYIQTIENSSAAKQKQIHEFLPVNGWSQKFYRMR